MAPTNRITNPDGSFRCFQMDEDVFTELSNNDGGICTDCGETASNVESDARKYRCAACGAHRVYGAELLLVAGRIEFLDECGSAITEDDDA